MSRDPTIYETIVECASAKCDMMLALESKLDDVIRNRDYGSLASIITDHNKDMRLVQRAMNRALDCAQRKGKSDADPTTT